MSATSPRLTLISDPEIARKTDFDLFWTVYPRKRAKLDAERAWQQTAKQRPPIEQLIGALQARIQSGEWADPRFIPYPASWLRSGCWDDEV